MSVMESTDATVILQSDFSGGLNMLNPKENQFWDGLNGIIREGKFQTRPGVRQYLKADGGYISGFWFNEDNAKYNDGAHTGFWFPFDFVRSPWGEVQGCQIVRLSSWTRNKIIFASGGAVYVYEDGSVTEVSTTPAIASDEEITFVQANNNIFMFRGEAVANWPLVWDGGTGGFVQVDPAGVGDDILAAIEAVYHGGRLWMAVQDDIYASASLNFTEYQYTTRAWSVHRYGEESGVVLMPFHEDSMLAFKKNRIDGLIGINAVIEAGSDLVDYVTIAPVDTKRGLVARYAKAIVGEDVWFLGWGGIYSIGRNEQNKFMTDPVPVSFPIQPYIDEINWDYVHTSCAIAKNNYVIFAVPMGMAKKPNTLLVYDVLRRAWCPPWTGTALNPIRFFEDDENLIFLSQDNRVRVMFQDDPWDSENYMDDIPEYDADRVYEAGEYCRYESDGDKAWKALVTTKGNLPTDSNFWIQERYPELAHDIKTRIKTRLFEEPSVKSSMAGIKGEIHIRHEDVKLTLKQFAEGLGAEKYIFIDREYDFAEYRLAKDDWDPVNPSLDANDPGRKDYPLFMGDADDEGIYAHEDTGIYAGVKTKDSLRFVPMQGQMHELGLELESSRGWLEVSQIDLVMNARPMGRNAVV